MSLCRSRVNNIKQDCVAFKQFKHQAGRKTEPTNAADKHTNDSSLQAVLQYYY